MDIDSQQAFHGPPSQLKIVPLFVQRGPFQFQFSNENQQQLGQCEPSSDMQNFFDSLRGKAPKKPDSNVPTTALELQRRLPAITSQPTSGHDILLPDVPLQQAPLGLGKSGMHAFPGFQSVFKSRSASQPPKTVTKTSNVNRLDYKYYAHRTQPLEQDQYCRVYAFCHDILPPEAPRYQYPPRKISKATRPKSESKDRHFSLNIHNLYRERWDHVPSEDKKSLIKSFHYFTRSRLRAAHQRMWTRNNFLTPTAIPSLPLICSSHGTMRFHGPLAKKKLSCETPTERIPGWKKTDMKLMIAAEQKWKRAEALKTLQATEFFARIAQAAKVRLSVAAINLNGRVKLCGKRTARGAKKFAKSLKKKMDKHIRDIKTMKDTIMKPAKKAISLAKRTHQKKMKTLKERRCMMPFLLSMNKMEYEMKSLPLPEISYTPPKHKIKKTVKIKLNIRRPPENTAFPDSKYAAGSALAEAEKAVFVPRRRPRATLAPGSTPAVNTQQQTRAPLEVLDEMDAEILELGGEIITPTPPPKSDFQIFCDSDTATRASDPKVKVEDPSFSEQLALATSNNNSRFYT